MLKRFDIPDYVLNCYYKIQIMKKFFRIFTVLQFVWQAYRWYKDKKKEKQLKLAARSSSSN